MKSIYLLSIALSSLILLSCSPAEKKPESQVKQTVPALKSESEVKQTAPSSNPDLVPMAKQKTATDCRFSLGFDVWEPYQYIDVNDEVRGLDIELISAAIENMGCEVTYKQGTWVLLLEELKNGQVDMLLGASKTESREEYAHFSAPYRMEEFSLYIRKNDTKHADFADIDEFIVNGSRIGIVGDYYYGPEISIMLDGSVTSKYFVPGIMGEMNIARLLDDDIDGFLEDSFVGASMLRRKALNNYISAHGYTVKTGEIYVMFSKKSVAPEQVSHLNEQLAEMQDSGEFESIMNKYSR